MPRAPTACVAALGLVVLACCAVVWGHGSPPPALPPAPPAVNDVTNVVHVKPVRWSWVHWWESNRDVYLKVLVQARQQEPDQAALARMRKGAGDALMEALKDDAYAARASAAIALGQMRYQGALEPLKTLADKDSNDAVRRCAVIAIGLLDTPGAQDALQQVAAVSPVMAQARQVAFGLMTDVNVAVADNLRRQLGGSDAAAEAIAAWALRLNRNAGNDKALGDMIAGKDALWPANEALLAMRGVDSSKGLAAFLLGAPSARSSPAWRALEQLATALKLQVYDLRPGNYERKYGDYVKATEEFNKNNPNRAATTQPTGKPKVRSICVGYEEIYLARLRASAAIALGEHDDDISRAALRKCLEEKPDGFNHLYQELAMIALGKLHDAQGADMLLRGLNSKPARNGPPDKDDQTLSLKGFAAIGLGLYCRPVPSPQGTIYPPHSDTICEALAKHMADAGEDIEVRSACAVALGLSGRTETLKHLVAASEKLRAGDDLLNGYVLLARGMLGDHNIIEPAAKYLEVRNDKVDPAGIMGRRAAVLGLGLTGLPEAVPPLVKAWDLSYYVNREVPIALSLCKAYGQYEPLVKLMKDKTSKPLERAFAARCLGELFISERPQRLAGVTNGGNYMFKNMPMMPYQALANEFLYTYLMAMFGEEWK